MSYSIPYTMIPGTKARAQEVNANFKYVTDSLDELSGAKMNATLSNLTVDGIEVIKNLTCFRNIGEIISSAIPLTDAGLHLLDGALISGSGTYSDFVDYIADLYETDPTADYFTTEADWQTAVTTYGVCGKFVYDSVNNTVRLPKYSNKIYTDAFSSDTPVVGNGKALGLTNGNFNDGSIYGAAVAGFNNFARLSASGAGTDVGSSSSYTSFTDGKKIGVSTDPDKSGIIADLTNITTSLDGYYYIVVATSSKTDVQVNIDEIATDLNGKADTDLSNVPTSKGILSESYVNGTSWYRVYSDGWCEQGGNTQTSSTTTESNITFLKPFTNTNYTIVALPNAKSGTSYAFNDIDDQTASGCIIRNPTACYGHMWVAYGYIR